MALPSLAIQPLLTGLVLAGGQSRRMGRDKALLRWQGEALLSLTVKRAQLLCEHVRIITPWPERYTAVLPQGCEVVREAAVSPGERSPGPLVALSLGLATVETDWALLLACDLPCLSVEELSRAVKQLPGLGEEIDAYLPRSPLPLPDQKAPGRASPSRSLTRAWEPLCGFYRQRCWSSLENSLAQEEHSLQRWLMAITVEPLRGLSPEALLNCNRPEDWERAQAILARRSCTGD